MRTIYLTICTLLISSACFAQETIEVTEKINKDIIAVYNVLKDDRQVKQGLYQVKHDKNKAIASGMYTKNKKTGIWHYFNYSGTLVQNFDHDNNKILYEAPDDGSFNYVFDKDFAAKDTVTKPMRIGGRYFGYFPYTRMFKAPNDLVMYNNTEMDATVELLISPGGRLADFTIHLKGFDYQRDLNVNIDLMSVEDLVFIPATVNHEPIGSRIIIHGAVNRKGELVISR